MSQEDQEQQGDDPSTPPGVELPSLEEVGQLGDLQWARGLETMVEVIEESVEEEGPADLHERYRRSLRSITGLPEPMMRIARLGKEMEFLPSDEAVWYLDQLIRHALWGRQEAIDGMLAGAQWLLRAQDETASYAIFQRLFEAAYEEDRRAVLFLLRTVPPLRALPKGRKLPEVRLPFDRDISLGERRQLASGSRRELIGRLLYDPDAMVIGKLLRNPILRQRDVLQVATRRPNDVSILREVALSLKWVARHDVREALVMNPFTSTSLSLKLLPTLRIDKLRPLRHAGDLHPAIPDFAEVLVELREQRTAPWRH